MLSLAVDKSGNALVTQKNIQPTVYFDHWALMELSMNQKLSQKFIESLKNRNGTLALSWLNLLEYSKINDGIDFLHAIVPLSYCDYVILDGYWADQANKASQRLVKIGQIEPIAKAFSGRKNGLQKFVNFFISDN